MQAAMNILSIIPKLQRDAWELPSDYFCRVSAFCCISAFAVLAPAHAFAGEVLALQHGIYVDQSQRCSNPANAGIKSYDGKGLSTAHTHDCLLSVRSKKRNTYMLTQRCVDAGAGPAPVVREEMEVAVINSRKFIFTQGHQATTFNYCPPSALPLGLK
jgi:hypothetical protein